MIKNVSRILQGMLAISVVGAFVWGSFLDAGPLGREKPNNVPSIAVTGDSTNYTLYDCLLPRPYNGSQASVADTVTFKVRNCDNIVIYAHGDWDSLMYFIDRMVNGKDWTVWKDSTLINGTIARSFPPVTSNWNQKLWLELTRTAIAGSLQVIDGFQWEDMRIRMHLADLDSTKPGGTMTLNADADTAINVAWDVFCISR